MVAARIAFTTRMYGNSLDLPSPEPDPLSVVATRVGLRAKRVEFYALRFAVVPRSGRVAGVARPQTEPLDPVLDEHGATAVDDRELNSEFLVSHGSLDLLRGRSSVSSRPNA